LVRGALLLLGQLQLEGVLLGVYLGLEVAFLAARLVQLSLERLKFLEVARLGRGYLSLEGGTLLLKAHSRIHVMGGVEVEERSGGGGSTTLIQVRAVHHVQGVGTLEAARRDPA
jgi:hypothetical protein